MPYKNPESKKEWRRRNAEAIGRYTAEWKSANPDRVKTYVERQKADRRERARQRPARVRSIKKDPEYQRKWRIEQRLKAMAAMGGRCEHCGFDDPRALEFDHKQPQLRLSSGLRRGDNTAELNAHLRNGTLAEVFQLLCANCHRIKTREAGEYTLRGVSVQENGETAVRTLPLLLCVGPIPTLARR